MFTKECKEDFLTQRKGLSCREKKHLSTGCARQFLSNTSTRHFLRQFTLSLQVSPEKLEDVVTKRDQTEPTFSKNSSRMSALNDGRTEMTVRCLFQNRTEQ